MRRSGHLALGEAGGRVVGQRGAGVGKDSRPKDRSRNDPTWSARLVWRTQLEGLDTAAPVVANSLVVTVSESSQSPPAVTILRTRGGGI